MRLIFVILSVGILLLQSGCLEQEPLELGYLRFHHVSPDAESIDIYDNGSKLNDTPFRYSYATIYVPVVRGEHNLKFRDHSTDQLVKEVNVTVEKDKLYSVYLTNESASMEVVYKEDNISATASDSPFIRLAHLSPDLDPVVFEIIGPNLISEQALSYAEVSDFQAFPTGVYSLIVRKVGSEQSLFLLENVSIQSGNVYTFMLQGYSSNPSTNSHWLELALIKN